MNNIPQLNFFRACVTLIIVFTGIILLVASALYIPAKISIWRERQYGKAELARAESNRQIKVCEAQADLESAKRYSEAEVIRAYGVAEANKIIGDSLKDNEAYLRYLWVQGLQTNQMQTIYVPTEAGLPILEAGKR